jgi:hypothetical protein
LSATLSETVIAGSNIVIALNSGGTVTLTAAAVGNTLSGTYTVSGSQNSADLAVASYTVGLTTDLAGNVLTSVALPTNVIGNSKAIVIDTTVPTISSFFSATPDAAYKAGSTVDITATASESVAAGSTIVATLSTGKAVTLIAVTAGTTLSGVYTVAAGDTSADLGVSSFTAGTVSDIAGNLLTSTTLPTNRISDTKAIVIDTAAPTITGFSTTKADGSYKAGDTVAITATASEAILSGGNIVVTLNTGKAVSLAAATTGTTLSGTYTIGAGDTTADLGVSSFAVGSATDLAGNPFSSTTLPTNVISNTKAIVVDTTGPTVTGFSTTKADGSYKAGVTVDLVAIVSESVASASNIVVTLSTGSTVTLTAASAGTSLAGTYTVAAGDNSADLGIVSYTVGTASDLAGNALASTTLPGNVISNVKAIVIDNVAPVAALINAVATDDVIGGPERTAGVVVSGTNEAGATVTVNGSAAMVSGATWSFALDAAAINALGQGSKSLTVVSTDAAGNASTATKTISIDTVTAVTIDLVAGNDVINATERTAGVTLTGTNEAGASVTVDGAQATVSGTTWSYALSASAIDAFGQGSKTFSVLGTDGAGNTATVTKTIRVSTLGQAPSTVDTVANDDVINAAERTAGITLTGTNEVGASTTINGGAVSAATSTTWRYALTSAAIDALGQGNQSLTIVTTGADGTATTSKTIAIDTVAPTAPTINTLASDNVINAFERTAGVALTGTNESGATVTVNGTLATVSGSTWSLQLDATMIDGFGQGSKTFNVVSTDAAGNTSANAKTIAVDTVAPTAPIVNAVATDDVINLAESAAGVTVTGTNESGSTVSVNGLAATVSGTTWSCALDTTTMNALGQGNKTLTVVATDAAGNTSTTSKSVAIDTVAPSTPVINVVATDDAINATERTAGVTLSGTNEAGATVTVNGATATVTGTSWSYALNATAIDGFGQGSKIFTLVATDPVGNTSASTKTILVDTVAPSSLASILLTLPAGSDNGTSNSDLTTNVTRPVISVGSLSGVAMVAGDTVQILDNTFSGTTTTAVASNLIVGSYMVTAQDLTGGLWNRTTQDITLSAALYSVTSTGDNNKLTVRLVDAAGNTGTVSTTPLTVLVDVSAPSSTASMATATLDLTTVTDTGASSTDDVTSIRNPKITVALNSSIKASTNYYIEILDNSSDHTNFVVGYYKMVSNDVSASSLWAGAGSLELTLSNSMDGLTPGTSPSSLLSEGTHTLTAIIGDKSGNGATPSAPLVITIDATAPTATYSEGSYTASSDTLVITGANLSTLLSTGEGATTDIKTRLDWSKFSWDLDGDSSATDISFAISDISSAKVTDSTHLSLVLSTSKATALEALTNFGTTGGADTIDITAGFARDLAFNVATTDGLANMPLTFAVI